MIGKMGIVEIVKEWAGIGVAVCAAIYGVVKYIHDFRNGRESVRQNQQHTEQEKLATDEKALDLDSRRVEAAEEVASKSVEQLAERSEENLILMDKEYNARKEIIQLKHRVSALEDALSFIKDYVCFEEDCLKRRPPLGTYKPKCLRNGEGDIQA